MLSTGDRTDHYAIKRRQLALEVARAAGGDSLIALDQPTVAWLTGYAQPFERTVNPFGAPPVAVVLPDATALVVVDERSAANVRGPGCVAQAYAGYDLGEMLDAPGRCHAAVTQAVRDLRPVADRRWLPSGLAGPIVAAELQSDLLHLRERKYPDEIDRLREAVRACDAGQAAARLAATAGATELEVWSDICAACEQSAGEPLEIFGTVASGPRSRQGGGPPTVRELRDGDAVLVDIAPRVGGYWGDSCATFVVGSASEELIAAHRLVLGVLEDAVAGLSPGRIAGDIDCAARTRLRFHHHLGHGIGTSFHEQPRLVPGGDTTLEPGMVIAIEPGYYTEDWGIRCEQVVLITHDGHEVLATHELTLC